MEALFGGLANSTTPGLLALGLACGVLAGLLAGLAPGVSGRAGLLLVTPLAFGFGPAAGAAFLVAFHSVVHTTGSIPAILLGAPTSAAEAATVLEGFPMARKGEGGRAVGASLAASTAGGVIGGMILLAMTPVAFGAARFIGSPEAAALTLAGFLSISALSGGRMAGGLIGCCLGAVIASVGVDPFSGAPRFTAGLPVLWDGVNAAALVTGLFVVPDLVKRASRTNPAAEAGTSLSAVVKGFREGLRRRWLLIRTAVLGALVGMAPGLGASVAVWMAYGHARETEPSAVPYGEGALPGLLAPEVANNAKEGGALAPTLFFGIPGSSGMGILLAGFALLGVEVGPRLLSENPGFIYAMGLTNIAANLLAAPICLLLAPAMARFAMLRREIVAPVALAAGATAAAMTAPGGATVAMIAVFSGLGLTLSAARLPRAPVLLGFVLAPALESNLVRSVLIYGWDALARPGVLMIAVIGGGAVLWRLSRRRSAPPEPQRTSRALVFATAGAAAVFVAAALATIGAPATARAGPSLAAAIGAGAAILTGARLWRARERQPAADAIDLALVGLFLAMLAGMAAVGPAPAAAAFVFAALRLRARLGWASAAIVAGVLGGLLFALSGLQR